MQPLHVILFNLFTPLWIIPQVFKDLVFNYPLYLFELAFSLSLHLIMVFLFSSINYLVCHSWLEMFRQLNQRFHSNNHEVFIINHLFQVISFFKHDYFFHFHLLIYLYHLISEFLFNHLMASYQQKGKALYSSI